MKIGKAYAFFDYKGKEEKLPNLLEVARDDANFSPGTTFHILSQEQRRGLHKEILEAASRLRVYGSTFSGCSPEVFDEASEARRAVHGLSHVVSGEIPLESNCETAGMLNDVLKRIAYRTPKAPFYQAVLYVDSKRRVQKL